jgi:hypothetical protein
MTAKRPVFSFFANAGESFLFGATVLPRFFLVVGVLAVTSVAVNESGIVRYAIPLHFRISSVRLTGKVVQDTCPGSSQGIACWALIPDSNTAAKLPTGWAKMVDLYSPRQDLSRFKDKRVILEGRFKIPTDLSPKAQAASRESMFEVGKVLGYGS